MSLGCGSRTWVYDMSTRNQNANTDTLEPKGLVHKWHWVVNRRHLSSQKSSRMSQPPLWVFCEQLKTLTLEMPSIWCWVFIPFWGSQSSLLGFSGKRSRISLPTADNLLYLVALQPLCPCYPVHQQLRQLFSPGNTSKASTLFPFSIMFPTSSLSIYQEVNPCTWRGGLTLPPEF